MGAMGVYGCSSTRISSVRSFSFFFYHLYKKGVREVNQCVNSLQSS
jgi:hypothetical protein